MAKAIPLSRGQVAIVDDADFKFLTQWKWSAMKRRRGLGWYAVRTTWKGGRTDACFFMHRVLVGAEPGQMVDHRDGDGLNNRRSNLRIATQAQNNANARKHRMKAGKPCASPYKGVSKCGSKPNPWKAIITVSGRMIHLGVFPTQKAAARAYDAAARLHYGEFAKLNFPGTEVASDTDGTKALPDTV